MDNSISLTVAIPTYNRCKSLLNLIKLIEPQLRTGDDLLVVDDGSQDGTAEMLGSIPHVRLVRHSSNQGMVKAWNACLAAAACEWICIVHNDDLIAPDALEVIRRVCSVANEPSLIGHKSSNTDIDSSLRYHVSGPGAWAVLNSLMIPSGVTIHKDVIKAIGCFDERFAYSADIEYFARICARYQSIIIESPQILEYQLHSDNYQYKTWHEPDFLAQLEEIEKLVRSYSGLSEQASADWFRLRWTNYITHMFFCAARIRDKKLLRETGRLLCNRPDVNQRLRLLAYTSSILGWYPRLSALRR